MELLIILQLLGYVLCHSTNHKVLIVSFDGFRYDYLDMVKNAGKSTPNFDIFIKNGSKAEYARSSFVSKTFPNHFSIATGRFEENHGVVANEYYDPVYNQTFEPRSDAGDSKWWNNGSAEAGPEPIWITNQKGPQTVFQRRSGVYFWVGSEAKYNGLSPYHYKVYNKATPYEERINTVINWFATETDPINLGMTYFEEPDHTGHMFGPDSDQVIDKIVELDGVLGSILHGLETHHLLNHMNIILVSDHGMTSVANDRVINLSQYLNSADYDHYGGSPVWNIQPKNNKTTDEIFDKLKDIPHLHVYRKKDIPKEYHYTYNRRIMPIVIAAEEGWMISTDNQTLNSHGNHGYNNSLMSMHPFFLALGPAFQRAFTSQPFNLVDVYPLVCAILDIDAAPNDGSMDVAGKMLVKEDDEHEGFLFDITMVTFLCVVAFAALVSGVFCVAVCRMHRFRKRRTLHTVPLDNFLDGQVHLLGANSDDDDEI